MVAVVLAAAAVVVIVVVVALVVAVVVVAVEVVVAVDVNEKAIDFAKRAMKKKLPEDVFVQANLKEKANWGYAEGAHLLLLTPPCEGDSRAGKQLHTSDNRNCLEEAIGAIVYLGVPVALIELVPGAMDNAQMIKDMQLRLAIEDYRADPKVTEASRHLPQNRRRIMVCVSRADVC